MPLFCALFKMMDDTLEKAWKDTVARISESYGEKLDYTTILFLIGLQELGQDFRKFKKDEKVDLMHIGLCTVLQPFGYYTLTGKDEEGWPHFKRADDMPRLNPEEQDKLVKKAIIKYFGE